MRTLSFVVLILALFLAGCQPSATEAVPVASATVEVLEDGFKNPVIRQDFPDPFLLQVGETYFAYATNGSGKNVQVVRSEDLISWELLTDAMPALPTWAKLTGGLTWAPEVIQIGGQFVLYYTTRDKASNKQCVGVAVSDLPEGKFKDKSDQPLVCQSEEGGTIDASPFWDGDRLYLYYKNDGNCCGIPTYLYVQELAADGLSLVGEPVRLIRNDLLWEGHVIEAPTMFKHEGHYYLFYSANDYAGVPYAVGYATCDTPLGPCEKAAENPILASGLEEKPFVIGPGHQTLFEVNGQTWMMYHVWVMLPSGLRGDQRVVWIDRIEWREGKPVLLGPTRSQQAKP